MYETATIMQWTITFLLQGPKTKKSITRPERLCQTRIDAPKAFHNFSSKVTPWETALDISSPFTQRWKHEARQRGSWRANTIDHRRITLVKTLPALAALRLLSDLVGTEKVFSEMKNEVIISYNNRSLLNELVSVGHPKTIRHVSTLYVKTLRHIVPGCRPRRYQPTSSGRAMPSTLSARGCLFHSYKIREVHSGPDLRYTPRFVAARQSERQTRVTYPRISHLARQRPRCVHHDPAPPCNARVPEEACSNEGSKSSRDYGGSTSARVLFQLLASSTCNLDRSG